MKNLLITIASTSLTIETFKDNPVIVFIGVSASVLLFLNQLYIIIQVINKKHKGSPLAFIKSLKLIKKITSNGGKKTEPN